MTYFLPSYFSFYYFPNEYFNRSSQITPAFPHGSFFLNQYFPSPYFDNSYFDRQKVVLSSSSEVPSTIRDTFESFRQNLITDELFTDSNVIISLDEDEFPQSGVAYCLLCPHDFYDNDPFTSGGGRNVTVLSGQFSVIIRTRNRLNTPYQDSFLVLNTDTTGILYLADQVANILQLSFPYDNAGNLLVSEPPRVWSISKASRAGTQGEWGGVKMLFEVSIRYNLPLAV